MQRRYCKIWTISRSELLKLVEECNTFKEILEKLGYAPNQGSRYRVLKQRMQEENIDVEQFSSKSKAYSKKINQRSKRKNIDYDEYLCENSRINRQSVKKHILYNNLIPHECALCGLKSTWNGDDLTLELDHINQINNDNRIENLRFLCPNCHSQVTNNHRKQNKAKRKLEKRDVCSCGNSKTKISKTCKKCFSKLDRIHKRKFNVTVDELTQILKDCNYNICKVGRHFNVSDVAIRKRCKKLGVTFK